MHFSHLATRCAIGAAVLLTASPPLVVAQPALKASLEQQLLKELPRIEGRIDIPDTKARVLIQPMGRSWDYFHEVLLHWGAAIVLLGTLALLGAASAPEW